MLASLQSSKDFANFTLDEIYLSKSGKATRPTS